MKRIKTGIVGCGTIGKYLAQAIVEQIEDLELVAIADIDSEKAEKLRKDLPEEVRVLSNEELIGEVDLVIETASQEAVKTTVREAIEAGKDVLVMSTGGLLGNLDLFDLVRKKGAKIYLPSGAIAGLDGLKAATSGKIERVTLRTTKPPKGLVGAPYLVERGIDLSLLKDRTTLFEGPALEAIKGFPANVNVAATLSLAGIGAQETTVEIIADPVSEVNIHEVFIEGDFGRISIRCENLPSPFNPKTSYLAALSAIATLKGIAKPVKIGT